MNRSLFNMQTAREDINLVHRSDEEVFDERDVEADYNYDGLDLGVQGEENDFNQDLLGGEDRIEEGVKEMNESFGPLLAVGERCLILKITRSNDPVDHIINQYYITSNGLYKTERPVQDAIVRIGRLKWTDLGERPNDIMLPSTDRAISRTHCKIDYSKAFQNSCFHSSFKDILMVVATKDNNALCVLPLDVIRHIWSFLRQPPLFELYDSGSVSGTFVKIPHEIGPSICALEKGFTVLLGADSHFDVLDAKVEYDSYEISCSDNLHISHNGESRNTESRDRYPINGPYLDICFKDNERHVLVRGSTNYEWTIGRGNSCSITLTQNTISRKQCRIWYEDKQWFIADGYNVNNEPNKYKQSANGTWRSLTDYRMKAYRTHSKEFKIDNGMEIKVSETQFTCHIVVNEGNQPATAKEVLERPQKLKTPQN